MTSEVRQTYMGYSTRLLAVSNYWDEYIVGWSIFTGSSWCTSVVCLINHTSYIFHKFFCPSRPKFLLKKSCCNTWTYKNNLTFHRVQRALSIEVLFSQYHSVYWYSSDAHPAKGLNNQYKIRQCVIRIAACTFTMLTDAFVVGRACRFVGIQSARLSGGS